MAGVAVVAPVEHVLVAVAQENGEYQLEALQECHQDAGRATGTVKRIRIVIDVELVKMRFGRLLLVRRRQCPTTRLRRTRVRTASIGGGEIALMRE
jgi:hypothetical protein